MNIRTILLTLLFALLLLVIVIANDSGTLPDFLNIVYSVPFGDKISHFVLTGLLSMLVNLSLSCRKTHLVSRDLLLGSLLVGTVVTVEELTQIFFPTRSVSIFDLLAGYLGIWLFGRLAVRFSTRYETRAAIH